MDSIIKTKMGTIKISETVLAKIISDVVMSSYGVVGLAYRNAAEGIFTLFNQDKMFKGVKLSIVGNTVDVAIDVVIEYGVKIPTFTENLSESIAYRVEKITGAKVRNINIYVQGIRF